jgi:hypothetical protein
MKFPALLIAILLVTVSYVAAGDGEKKARKANNWQPIVGFKNLGQKAFINAATLETTVTDTGDSYNFGEVLLSSDKILQLDIKGKKIAIRSMVKQMIIECKSGLMAPVSDLYFDVERPSIISKPVAGVDYESVRDVAEILPKNSILYQALCPVYI